MSPYWENQEKECKIAKASATAKATSQPKPRLSSKYTLVLATCAFLIAILPVSFGVYRIFGNSLFEVPPSDLLSGLRYPILAVVWILILIVLASLTSIILGVFMFVATRSKRK